LSLTDKAFDLAKGMTMKVNAIPITNKRSIKTEYDENNIKRKKENLVIVKDEALSMGQVFRYFILCYIILTIILLIYNHLLD